MRFDKRRNRTENESEIEFSNETRQAAKVQNTMEAGFGFVRLQEDAGFR